MGRLQPRLRKSALPSSYPFRIMLIPLLALTLAAIGCDEDDGTDQTTDPVQGPTGGTGGATGAGGTTGAGWPGSVGGGGSTGGGGLPASVGGGSLTGGGGTTGGATTGGGMIGGSGSTTGGGTTGGGTTGGGTTGGGTPGGGGTTAGSSGSCTQTPVSGLSLSAIDVFQTVQIRVMKDGQSVPRGTRNADVVVGRKTVFRVHVTPDAGWTAREVEVRVELTDASSAQQQAFFAMLKPTGPSSDANLQSTFQVSAPAEAIKPDTRYAVTLLECGAAPGAGTAASRARFPSEGFEELGARQTGPLKVHIIPVMGTDVSEAGLRPFKERLEAVYPITQVMFTIGPPATGSGASSMCSLLSAVQARRSADRPAADIYYYGLSPGILGGQSGCSNAGGSKVSAGWAGGYSGNDPRIGAGTMCHELGHAHGRLHAPCNVQDPDRRFPYPNANIGIMGYDNRTNEFYQSNRKDMMSYCPEPRYNAWISDYTYQAILERAAQVNAQMNLSFFGADDEVEVAWRLLVSDSAGVHWGDEPLLVEGTPEGESLRAIVHGDDGPAQEVEVYKQDLEDGSDNAFLLIVPQRDASWRAIEVPGLLAPQAF
jgi:hypothetical protein